ncbi:DUF4192 domain-containing protein [Glycomyces sp. NPDC048151]|uniref:DUF4192 domain-containing protein n=1 Tax=Glycomyces sp. NPDC048151 TaxID=3364002 RepID=UPI00371678E4
MNAPAQLKLNGPADLLSAVPYLLGFTPEHSLVVVALKRGELQCTFRVDLPGSVDHLDHLPSLTKQLENNDADTVVLIAYGEDAIATAAVQRAAMELDLRDITIFDQLRVTDGRYYNLGCTGPCCPTEGQPLTDNSAIGTELIASGAVRRTDRNAITELFAPAPAEQRAAVTRAIDDALHTEADLDWAEQRRHDLAVIDRWLEADTLPERPEDIATLGLAVSDLDVRDYTLRNTDPHRETASDLWLWVARHLEDDFLAPALTIAGWCAYRTGNGVVAIEAFTLALKASPHYRLAQMLMAAVQAGIPPRALDSMSAISATA